ncbi:MAG: UbiA family prenyltransferase [Lentisphaeria bacterium]
MQFSKIQFRNLNSWLQIVRIPNLFTVPGDPLAGLFTAAAISHSAVSLHHILLVPCIALFFYVFGMILNDLCDIDEDAVCRPERPLSSGRISIVAARTAAIGFAAAGLGLALVLGAKVFVTSLMLTFLIAAYNILFKRNRVQGPLAMGLCRGFSFLVGASVFDWPLSTVILAVMLAGYIASITYIASFENRMHNFGKIAILPLLCMAGIGFYVTARLSVVSSPYLLFSGAMVLTAGLIMTGGILRKLTIHPALPSTSRATVGTLLRNLVFIQSGLLLMAPGTVSTLLGILVLLVGWPANALLAAKFSAS